MDPMTQGQLKEWFLNRAGEFPFTFLVAGVVIGIACIGLMFWKSSEA